MFEKILATFPEIILAVQNPLGLGALLLLLGGALLTLSLTRRSTPAPWYAVLIAFAMMTIATLALIALIQPSAAIAEISVLYGTPDSIVHTRPEFDMRAATCVGKRRCSVKIGNADAGFWDPAPNRTKVVKLTFACGEFRRTAYLLDNVEGEIWCN